MSNAKEIVEQRFAKGEINEEQYDELLSKLSSTSSAVYNENSLQSINKTTSTNNIESKFPFGLLAFGVLVVVGYSLFTSLKEDRVHVTTLSSSGFLGDTVNGTLLTEGGSGYIYLWVEMNGKIMCPKKTYVQTGVPQKFSFYCSAMGTNGRFKVITNRSPSNDWITKNATSL